MHFKCIFKMHFKCIFKMHFENEFKNASEKKCKIILKLHNNRWFIDCRAKSYLI
jgi:hypothetical protein